MLCFHILSWPFWLFFFLGDKVMKMCWFKKKKLLGKISSRAKWANKEDEEEKKDKEKEKDIHIFC